MASWKRVSSVENLEVGVGTITTVLQYYYSNIWIYIAYTKGKVH